MLRKSHLTKKNNKQILSTATFRFQAVKKWVRILDHDTFAVENNHRPLIGQQLQYFQLFPVLRTLPQLSDQNVFLLRINIGNIYIIRHYCYQKVMSQLSHFLI